jgi:hypothetical protein
MTFGDFKTEIMHYIGSNVDKGKNVAASIAVSIINEVIHNYYERVQRLSAESEFSTTSGASEYSQYVIWTRGATDSQRLITSIIGIHYDGEDIFDNQLMVKDIDVDSSVTSIFWSFDRTYLRLQPSDLLGASAWIKYLYIPQYEQDNEALEIPLSDLYYIRRGIEGEIQFRFGDPNKGLALMNIFSAGKERLNAHRQELVVVKPYEF